MTAETKTCQNCKQPFVIEPDDFAFYEKISVPPPSWCPDCRMVRRLLWRNERTLYKRTSDVSGKEMVSQYPTGTAFPVYDVPEFYSRDWIVPAAEYDPTRSFFEQFGELMRTMPRCTLLTDLFSFESGSVYQNASSRNKNCYMVFASGDNEDCLYGSNVDYCKHVVDGLWVRQVQYSYECIGCLNCNGLAFCEECHNCVDGYFLYNCKGCTSCLGCVNLKNKSYCLWNEQLSKEEYERRTKDMVAGLSPQKISEYRERLAKMSIGYPRKYAHIDSQSSGSCTGDYITDCRNVVRSFSVYTSQNVKYCSKLIGGSECIDVNDWGDPAELCYESITIGKGSQKCLFSNNCWPECRELQYCDSCSSSHHLFGCIGLKNASYCVLNKRYSEHDYARLVPHIIGDMKKRGEYGEFFPPALSPFAYSEAIAQEYFPLTKEEAIARGYRWRDQDPRSYQITKRPAELPPHIKDVSDVVVGEVIGCEHGGTCNEQCTTAFRLVPDELQFYRRLNVPLPHLCPNCRHHQRLKQRNPLKLWHRACQCAGPISANGVYRNIVQHTHGVGKCPNEFETNYSPDRPEIVYCENCYNAEVA